MVNTKPGRFPVALFAKASERKQDDREDDKGWVARTLNAPAPQGKRNDTLASLAGYFALTGIGPVVATEILQNWNKKNSPPLPDSEVEQSVLSVYKTASKRNPVPSDKHKVLPGEELFNLMDFGKYMSTFYGQDQSWLIKDWLPESTILFVVSPPAGHKTWILLDLAVSVASGSPFLGKFPVTDKGPVIIIQQEDFHGQTVERLSLITHNKLGIMAGGDTIDLPPSLPIYVHPDRKLKFEDEKVVESLRKQIEKIRPKLVIIDPLYSTVDADDYMKAAAGQMFALKDMRDKYGTGFVIAHHTKKGSSDSDREAAWGSQFLNAFLESGWQIRPQSDCIKLQRHFKQFANPKEIYLKFNIDTVDTYTYDVREAEKKVSKKEKKALDDEYKAPVSVDAKDHTREPKIEKGNEEKDPLKVKKKRSNQTVFDAVFDVVSAYPNEHFTIVRMAKLLDVEYDAVRGSFLKLVDKDHIVQEGNEFRWKNVP